MTRNRHEGAALGPVLSRQYQKVRIWRRNRALVMEEHKPK